MKQKHHKSWIAKKEGRALRHLRVTVGLTQQELAEEFGVTRPMVSNWETGVVRIRGRLRDLAEFYGVDLRDLHRYLAEPE